MNRIGELINCASSLYRMREINVPDCIIKQKEKVINNLKRLILKKEGLYKNEFQKSVIKILKEGKLVRWARDEYGELRATVLERRIGSKERQAR